MNLQRLQNEIERLAPASSSAYLRLKKKWGKERTGTIFVVAEIRHKTTIDVTKITTGESFIILGDDELQQYFTNYKQ